MALGPSNVNWLAMVACEASLLSSGEAKMQKSTKSIVAQKRRIL
jgi:hypothetical protein